MAGLATVDEMIATARVLLQDVAGQRYDTDTLVVGLNAGLLEARRLRPDLFLDTPNSTPNYTAAQGSSTVAIDQQYRMSLIYYMVGHVHLRDEEDTQDQRAAAFLNKFVAQLLTVAA